MCLGVRCPEESNWKGSLDTNYLVEICSFTIIVSPIAIVARKNITGFVERHPYIGWRFCLSFFIDVAKPTIPSLVLVSRTNFILCLVIYLISLDIGFGTSVLCFDMFLQLGGIAACSGD